ncbi:YciI family protein [soil metagenome]
MEYLLMATETEDAFAARTDPERTDEYWSAWTGFIAELAASGVMTAAAGLVPPTSSTTLRVRDGERSVQDGPFSDSKEHLGGYFVIDVADLDEALAWAARCPSAGYASVEVRPLLVMPD